MKTGFFQNYFKRKLQESPAFSLMTTMYDEDNFYRRREFITCFERNLAHPSIDDIFVFYEKQNKATSELYRYTSTHSDRVSLISIQERPTFKTFFDFANKELKGNNVIVANTDIYFDKSLQKLDRYDLLNNFMVLTRWNIAQDNRLYLQTRKNPVYPWKRLETSVVAADASLQQSHSADAWIFMAPIKTDFECNYAMGTYMSDSLLNYSLLQWQEKGGFSVFNPCLSVRACHLDRNVKGKSRSDYLEFAKAFYGAEELAKAKAGFVKWCCLDSMRLQRNKLAQNSANV